MFTPTIDNLLALTYALLIGVILNDLARLEWLAKFLVHKQVIDGAAYAHKLSALLVKVLLIAHVI